MSERDCFSKGTPDFALTHIGGATMRTWRELVAADLASAASITLLDCQRKMFFVLLQLISPLLRRVGRAVLPWL